MNHEQIFDGISKAGVSQQAEAKHLLDFVSAEQLTSLEALLSNVEGEEDAYRLLGEEAGVGAFGSDAIKAGKEAFLRSREKCREVVCGNAVVYDVCRRPSLQGSLTAAAIVLGALTEAKIPGINLPLVVTLMMRAGVDEYCASVWSKRL